MTSKVKNLLKYLGVASLSLGTVNFAQNLYTRQTLQAKYDLAVRDYVDLQNRFSSLSSETYNDFISNQRDLANLKVQLEVAKENMTSAARAAGNLSESSMSVESESLNSNILNQSIENANANIKSITDWVNSKGGFGSSLRSEMNSSIDQYTAELWELINSDNIIQLAATLNLIGLFLIFICYISFIGIFTGNKILNRFKWIEKYPRLKRFLELRFKFQQYYLMVDSFILVCVLLTLCFINLSLFSL